MVCDPWFRFHIGVRNDLSGMPYGFWFMWRPRPDKAKGWYDACPCSWKVGAFWYAPWSHGVHRWTEVIPRIDF